MRIRRWVVYEIMALPEPDDTVRRVAGPYFLRSSADLWVKHNGRDIDKFLRMPGDHQVKQPWFHRASRLPQKRWLWRTRRFLRKHGWELR